MITACAYLGSVNKWGREAEEVKKGKIVAGQRGVVGGEGRAPLPPLLSWQAHDTQCFPCPSLPAGSRWRGSGCGHLSGLHLPALSTGGDTETQRSRLEDGSGLAENHGPQGRRRGGDLQGRGEPDEWDGEQQGRGQGGTASCSGAQGSARPHVGHRCRLGWLWLQRALLDLVKDGRSPFCGDTGQGTE